MGVDAESERAKREAEAEVVGYVVGRHFGLDTSGSAFHLATWQNDDAEVLEDWFSRISSSPYLAVDIVDKIIYLDGR